MSTLLIPKLLQFFTTDKIINMSNNKNSEHKFAPSFQTTLTKIKKITVVYVLQNEHIKCITASEIHSHNRSFQTTARHSNQLNI